MLEDFISGIPKTVIFTDRLIGLDWYPGSTYYRTDLEEKNTRWLVDIYSSYCIIRSLQRMAYSLPQTLDGRPNFAFHYPSNLKPTEPYPFTTSTYLSPRFHSPTPIFQGLG